jgi:hypothetical protein
LIAVCACIDEGVAEMVAVVQNNVIAIAREKRTESIYRALDFPTCQQRLEWDPLKDFTVVTRTAFVYTGTSGKCVFHPMNFDAGMIRSTATRERHRGR